MALKNCSDEYADIIGLPHPVSKKHPQMSMHDRAAQFSPFAALTGYGEAIRETARVTDGKKEIDENVRNELDETMKLLLEQLPEHPLITVTYFQKDDRKEGGTYKIVEGRVKKIDFYERVLIMENQVRIKLDDIIGIEREVCCTEMQD